MEVRKKHTIFLITNLKKSRCYTNAYEDVKDKIEKKNNFSFKWQQEFLLASDPVKKNNILK